MNLNELIEIATQNNVSDIHINDAIFFRVNKKIMRFEPQSNLDSIKAELDSINTESNDPKSQNEKSFTTMINETKIRISYYFSNYKNCYAIRILKSKIPTLASLNTPKVLESLSLNDSGLILVCGATGVGKSTSLAAMINHINESANKHILTIEDPIEYEHKSKNSLITQREIRRDSSDFESALRASLRQDPDVILIGEILDSKVLKMAINHALSGHLVLASFHAFSCAHAVSRILGMCSDDANAHANLADCLQGIITQKLYADSSATQSLKADFEILIANPAVRILIKENKINQLDSQISMGREFGMQHFLKK